MPTIHILIKGRVQGVFYRATASDIAEEIGLTGWVKNTEEGHVEAVVSGATAQIERFVAWCKQGPSKAVVKEVVVTPREEEYFDAFTVLRGK